MFAREISTYIRVTARDIGPVFARRRLNSAISPAASLSLSLFGSRCAWMAGKKTLSNIVYGRAQEKLACVIIPREIAADFYFFFVCGEKPIIPDRIISRIIFVVRRDKGSVYIEGRFYRQVYVCVYLTHKVKRFSRQVAVKNGALSRNCTQL